MKIKARFQCQYCEREFEDDLSCIDREKGHLLIIRAESEIYHKGNWINYPYPDSIKCLMSDGTYQRYVLSGIQGNCLISKEEVERKFI